MRANQLFITLSALLCVTLFSACHRTHTPSLEAEIPAPRIELLFSNPDHEYRVEVVSQTAQVNPIHAQLWRSTRDKRYILEFTRANPEASWEGRQTITIALMRGMFEVAEWRFTIVGKSIGPWHSNRYVPLVLRVEHIHGYPIAKFVPNRYVLRDYYIVQEPGLLFARN